MKPISKPLPLLWSHSRIVYGKPTDKKSSILFKESKEFITMENDTDFAYVAIFDGYIIISFRGTDNIKGWISNLDPFPLDGDGYLKVNLTDGKWGKGMIHDGFYESWKFFKSCVDKIFETYHINHNSYAIYSCGHSRGGALAELCARHIAKNLKMRNSCITFASPAPGIKAYRDQFRSLPINGTRVVNGWDIVTDLPPHSIGFRHGCANKVWMKKAYWKKWVPWLRVKDHYTKSYEKAIKKRFN